MTDAAVRAKTKVPRACSDVFRFWVSLALGVLVALVFEIVVISLQATGARGHTDEQFELEFGFGARLTTWIGFAVTYLALGLRAFARCDRAELVRRVLAKPLPTSPVKRWLLAGGGGTGWPVVIAAIAFFTIITAVLRRGQSTPACPGARRLHRGDLLDGDHVQFRAAVCAPGHRARRTAIPGGAPAGVH